jgi:hypothetical protein
MEQTRFSWLRIASSGGLVFLVAAGLHSVINFDSPPLHPVDAFL